MTLDLNALRAKLNELSNKTRASDVLWKPQEGENRIRIVPLVGRTDNPFIEAYFHYLANKTYLSPLTFGEADPIEEFAQSLRAGGNLSKEDWAQTKKFVPKLRTFAPIIVRGKEAEGVRFWGFGKTTYQELLGYIADPEYGDIVDPMQGRDIRVDFTPAAKTKTGFNQTSIKISTKQTPITPDKDLLKKILEIQPDLFDVYKKQSYNELKGVLDKFLAPNPANPQTSSVKPDADEWDKANPGSSAADAHFTGGSDVSSPTADASKAQPSTKSPKDIDEEFDQMFNAK